MRTLATLLALLAWGAAAVENFVGFNLSMQISDFKVHNVNNELQHASFTVDNHPVKCEASETNFRSSKGGDELPCDRPGWSWALHEREKKATLYNLKMFVVFGDPGGSSLTLTLSSEKNLTLACDPKGAKAGAAAGDVDCHLPNGVPNFATRIG